MTTRRWCVLAFRTFVLVATLCKHLAADDPEVPPELGIMGWRDRALAAAARRVSELEATIRARDSEIAVLKAEQKGAHVPSPLAAEAEVRGNPVLLAACMSECVYVHDAYARSRISLQQPSSSYST
jgi:hypothetical protein